MGLAAKLAVLFGGGMIFIIILVARTFGIKDDLVAEDYYVKEIQYQERLNGLNRSESLQERPSWEQLTNGNIAFTFPVKLAEKSVKGDIMLMRPSDKSLDRVYQIQLNKGTKLIIPQKDLERGLYRVQISWVSNSLNYQEEGSLIVQ